MASGPLEAIGGKTTRTPLAFLCIGLGLVCGYLMDIPTLRANFPSPSATGFIEWPSGKVPILESFHWIPWLDVLFRDVTVGFAPSVMGYDDVSRWMMCPFMIDVGVWYFIWLLESSRGGNKGTVASYPALFALLAQIASGGVFLSIYCGPFLLFTTPVGRQTPAERRVDLMDAWIYLPLLIIFHYGPVLAMLYHPTFEGRHYWTWFWQLYAVRITIGYYTIHFLLAYLPIPKIRSRLSYHTTITLMFTPLIAISAAMWIYTFINCPYLLKHVFWPQPLVVDTWMGRIRGILQLDFLFVNGTSLVWMFGLLRDAGMVGAGSTIRIGLVAVVVTMLLGPTATLALLWVWRETLVGHVGDESKVGAEEMKKVR